MKKFVMAILLCSSFFFMGCMQNELATPTSEECNSIVKSEISIHHINSPIFTSMNLQNGWTDIYPKDYDSVPQSIWCHRGKEAGENLNYVYCDGIVGKRIMENDSEGNIVRSYTRIYEIYIVAEPTSVKKYGSQIAKVVGIDCMHIADYSYGFPYD